MRRNDRSALSMPAAVQRNTICPSRQRVTLRLVALAMEIIDSMGLDVVSVLARRPSRPSRATANTEGVTVNLRGSSTDREKTAWALIGADGVWSALRDRLFPDADPLFSG